MVSGLRDFKTDLKMDFLKAFPFLSGGGSAPRPLQPGPLNHLSLRAANPRLQLKECFPPFPLLVFSFGNNCLLSRDEKRELTKDRAAF